MALETGTYISDLVATNPLGSDLKSQGDDHIRLIKSTLQATFPNITGAVSPTHTELNNRAPATKLFSVSTALATSDYGKTIIPFGTGEVTVTLPAIAAGNAGGRFIIWTNNTNAAGVAIAVTGADTITTGNSSVTSLTLIPGDCAILENNGTSWTLIGGSASFKYAEAFKFTLANTGLQNFPSGLKIKWATVTASGTPGAALAVTFPTAFPTACHGILLTGVTTNTSNAAVWYDTKSASGFNLHAALASQSAFYVAWGE